jgi:teichuronic acid biosynthesis glycosyltransferase TuaG
MVTMDQMPGGVIPVSVVIPAYNAEGHIGAALASVHAPSVMLSEAIAVDDGSADRTAAIAAAAGALVRTNTRNSGPSRTRNAANCNWVTFLDADDTRPGRPIFHFARTGWRSGHRRSAYPAS